jgi:hypothetical protein
MTQSEARVFEFRPWVRRAGLSIVLVAAFATVAIVNILSISHERFAWVYVGVLWLGGLKILVGTFWPIVEVDDARLIVRPLHQFLVRNISWADVRGTEQSGDRLIVYFDTPRGMRFVALNLNLVKGRRDFLTLLESRLRSMGFTERMVESSRYLSRPA